MLSTSSIVILFEADTSVIKEIQELIVWCQVIEIVTDRPMGLTDNSVY